MTQSHIGIVELKACPFCGSAAELHENVQGRNYWYVTCPSCDFDLDMPTKAEAIAAWNTRDPIITEMVEALEAMVRLVRPNVYPQPDKPDSGYATLMRAEATLAKVRSK